MIKLLRIHTLLIAFLSLLVTNMYAHHWDIRQFGAVGDGTTDDTKAIQLAIDSCAMRGGKVFFPAGVFRSATLVLKSDVTLHFSAKSVLLGSDRASDYPYQDPGVTFYGGDWAKQALIYANGVTNVSIEGSGTLDGQGAQFISNTLKKPDRYRDRPYLLWFVQCKDIRVSGVTLRNSAFWMQHYLGCERLVIDGITVWNHSNKNNDMLDLDGCRDVLVRNLVGDADDDGITIKSTSPFVSENIVIDQCIISSHCNAIKLGTESTGGFRNIRISNCIIRPSAQRTVIYGKPDGSSGISLEMVDGGVMENIQVQGIIMEGTEVPIFVRLGNRARKYYDGADSPSIGIARNVHLSDITATRAGQTGCSIVGVPGGIIENVTLNRVDISFAGGGSDTLRHREIEELAEHYPEATMFGLLPAYGLFARHVDGLSLHQVRFSSLTADNRAAIVLKDASRVHISQLDAALSKTAPMIQAAAVDGLFMTNSWLPKDKKRQIQLTGSAKKIQSVGNFIGDE